MAYFPFSCRYPGESKVINFYDAEIKLLIFTYDMKRFKHGIFL